MLRRLAVVAAFLPWFCCEPEDVVPEAGHDVVLIERECPFAIPADRSAECYTLRVPLDRDEPELGDVELPVAVLHPPQASPPSRAPVVYLHGGPGGSAFSRADAWFERPLSHDGDLVIFDQRGSGEATPSLDCPEVEAGWFAVFTATMAPQAELELMAEAVQQCHDRLAAEVELDAFHTIASSDDLEDLRLALGVDRWSLFGISYGTRLALEAARSYPEGIESMVLDSVYPPAVGGVAWLENNGVAAIDRLVAGCLAEPGCVAKFPDLAANLDTAMASLDAQPYPASVQSGFGETVELQLTGSDMYASLYDALYDSNVIPFLPYVIASAGFGGDFDFLGQAASEAVPGLTRFSEGARLSIDCVDGGHFIDGDGAELEASVLAHPELTTIYQGQAVPFCAIWDVTPAPSEFTQPVVSDVPALILAGELDPVTPVWQSELAAATLSNAELFVFPGMGHAVSFDGECSAALVREFLIESTVIDSDCWAALSPITFP